MKPNNKNTIQEIINKLSELLNNSTKNIEYYFWLDDNILSIEATTKLLPDWHGEYTVNLIYLIDPLRRNDLSFYASEIKSHITREISKQLFED